MLVSKQLTVAIDFSRIFIYLLGLYLRSHDQPNHNNPLLQNTLTHRIQKSCLTANSAFLSKSVTNCTLYKLQLYIHITWCQYKSKMMTAHHKCKIAEVNAPLMFIYSTETKCRFFKRTTGLIQKVRDLLLLIGESSDISKSVQVHSLSGLFSGSVCVNPNLPISQLSPPLEVILRTQAD